MLFLKAEPMARTKPVSLNLSTIDIWGQMTLHMGTVLCISGYLATSLASNLGASSTLLASCVNQKCL